MNQTYSQIVSQNVLLGFGYGITGTTPETVVAQVKERITDWQTMTGRVATTIIVSKLLPCPVEVLRQELPGIDVRTHRHAVQIYVYVSGEGDEVAG